MFIVLATFYKDEGTSLVWHSCLATLVSMPTPYGVEGQLGLNLGLFAWSSHSQDSSLSSHTLQCALYRACFTLPQAIALYCALILSSNENGLLSSYRNLRIYMYTRTHTHKYVKAKCCLQVCSAVAVQRNHSSFILICFHMLVLFFVSFFTWKELLGVCSFPQGCRVMFYFYQNTSMPLYCLL